MISFCCVLALFSVMHLPQDQTEKIVLKHVAAAEVDARLSDPGLGYPKDLGWTVDYKRNSLNVTGSAESTKSVKGMIENLDWRPIKVLKLTARRLKLPEDFKSR
jgi:hypothetical protein